MSVTPLTPSESTAALSASPDRSTPTFSICVYCGSRKGVDPVYAEVALEVGTWIGQHGGQLVYGGGRNGLMGKVANATLAAGGRVLGIIPEALVEREWAHRECTELLVVDTMHTRKRLMAERCDAFLAIAGGIGTFEELFEAWTWRQLGYHDKPVGILNTAGYYDGLLGFIDHSVSQGFMDDSQMRLIEVDHRPKAILRRLVEQAGFPQPDRLDEI